VERHRSLEASNSKSSFVAACTLTTQLTSEKPWAMPLEGVAEWNQ
jgi:hypothetical protein